NASLHDLGVRFSPGDWIGLKAGYLRVRQPSFALTGTTNQRGFNESVFWRTDGFNERTWYVAMEVYLGGPSLAKYVGDGIWK
ncbi:MAG: hypothetical protein AAB289_10890, partial [Chloroflexota bacterium]